MQRSGVLQKTLPSEMDGTTGRDAAQKVDDAVVVG